MAVAALAASLLMAPASAQNSDPGASAATVSTPSAPVAPVSAPVPPRKSSKPAAGGYYVEFRAARIGIYGHSYAAYGRLDARGNPTSTSYADLHPMGGYAVMALGHFVPVPANTEWDPEVLELPIAAKYRVSLNETQYKSLLAAVQRANDNKRPYWNAVTNNCNHFVGELAQAVGLRVPMQFHLSIGFIPDLQAMNESTAPATTASAPPKVKPKPKVKPAIVAAPPAQTSAAAPETSAAAR